MAGTAGTGIPCCRRRIAAAAVVAAVEVGAADADRGDAIRRSGDETTQGRARAVPTGRHWPPRLCNVPACPSRGADDSRGHSFSACPFLSLVYVFLSLSLSFVFTLSFLSLAPSSGGIPFPLLFLLLLLLTVAVVVFVLVLVLVFVLVLVLVVVTLDTRRLLLGVRARRWAQPSRLVFSPLSRDHWLNRSMCTEKNLARVFKCYLVGEDPERM